jgi:chorismate mutase
VQDADVGVLADRDQGVDLELAQKGVQARAEEARVATLADDKVLAALAERMKVAQKIGELKKENGGAVMDADREAQKLVALQEKAEKILKP